MGACCSRKKKSSSKSVRRTDDDERREEECEKREEKCERREEECERKDEDQCQKPRRKGIFHHLNKVRRYKEEEGDTVCDIGIRNNSYKEGVPRHNILEYKLRSVKKKYESKNKNSTEFNPFFEEEEYPNSLNPFHDEENYPPGQNPFENTETSSNSSEICAGACRNHNDEIERAEVNSVPQSPLMATEADNSDSNAEVLENNEDDNFYNIESIVEDSGGFASPEGNSKSQSPMMATEAESNGTNVKIFGYNEEALRDLRYLYIPEFEVADIDISEMESCLVTEKDNESRMIDILKEDNVTEKCNDRDISNNKTLVHDKASYSKINQISTNENTTHCLIAENEKIKVSSELCNKIDEAGSINNITPENFPASKSMKTSNAPPAVKRKSLKKYKAPAPPVLPTLPSKIESHLVKKNDNLSKMCVKREEKELVKEFNNEKEASENKYRISRPAPPPPVHKPLQTQQEASKNKYSISRPAPPPPVHKPLQPQQEASKNKYSISRSAPPPPVLKPQQPQQEASKNKYSISRPAPPPPVPEPLQPTRPVADTMKETMVIPTKEYRRKDRRKSLMDLFKVKKKKKKSVDMF